MSNILKKLFSILGNDESKPDFQTCCTPMEVFEELKVISLFQVKHITVGFAEGDLIVIK